jgi:hypothetical protein
MTESQSVGKLFNANSRNGMRGSTRMVSVRIPEELLLRLAEVGNEEGLALSDTMRLVLERGLNQRRGKKP